MTESNFCIGARLEVTPVSPSKRNLWVAESAALPQGWSCVLVHRASADLLKGHPLTGWILNVDADQTLVEVSDSNFGFLPISDRMRPRYVTSLRRLVALIEKKEELSQTDADSISEVKGMFSRCARRDQWDWRAVHLALGEPSRGEARTLATLLGEVSAALRRGDLEAARAGILIATNRGDLALRLLGALEDAMNSAAPFSKSRAPRSRPKETGKSAGKSVLVLSSYAKEKLDSANATHSMLLDVLGQFLGFHGHLIEANQFVDAFTRLKSGPAIFEAKSITNNNELSQIRHGLSQLYEYRYRHDLTDAMLWLVLSQAPSEDWVIDYLEKDRGVHVVWLEQGQLSGPHVERLLESGSEALRRGR